MSTAQVISPGENSWLLKPSKTLHLINSRNLAFKIMVEICLQLEKHKHYRLATKVAQTLTRISPNNPIGYYRWGDLLNLQANKHDALQLFLKASSLLKDDKKGSDLKLLIESRINRFTRSDPFTFLPNEILHSIFSHLGLLEWTNFQQVSKQSYSYLANDYRLWNTCNFHRRNHDKFYTLERGCTKQRLRKFLLNATPRGEFKVREVNLNLSHFASLDEELKCLQLLEKSNFKKEFPKLSVHKLVICNYFCYRSKILEQLVPVKALVVKGYSTRVKNCLDLILKGQPFLKTLIWKPSLLLGDTLNMISYCSLKALQVYTYKPPTAFAINCITSFPNLEYFQIGNIKDELIFNLELFGGVLCKSKLKALSLEYLNIGRVHDVRTSPVNPIWPITLTSLNLSLCYWKEEDFRFAGGSLSQLTRLNIAGTINIPYFMEYFDIGTNLTHLTVYASFRSKRDFVWLCKRCPNIEYLGLRYDDFFNSFLVTTLLDHCHKLEEIDYGHNWIRVRLIVKLCRKKGLKRIGFARYEEEHLETRLRGSKLGNVSVEPFSCNTDYGDYESCKSCGII